MNHAKIAAEALRFRMATLHDPIVDPSRFDVDGAAAFAVTCGDPSVDSAIRRLGTAWVRAGLDPVDISLPWREADARRLLRSGGADLIDALDDIVRGISVLAVFT